MGILAAERNKSVERHRSLGTDIGGIDSQIPAFPLRSRIPFPPSIVSHRGNDPAFISPSGPGYFVTPARVDAFVSLPLVPPPLPPHRTATSRAFSLRYSTELFDKRDVERDQLSPSLPPPFLTTIPCLRSRYSTGTNSFDDLSNCGNHNPDYKLDFTRNILPLLLPLISIYHRHPPKRRSNVVSDSWANVIKSSPRHGGTA